MDVVDQNPNPEEYPDRPGSHMPTFEGFEHLTTSNSIAVPNPWMDIITGIDNLAEYKVVFYIMHHTCRHQGKAPRITLQELEQKTGLSGWDVRAGLRSAIERGFILCKPDLIFEDHAYSLNAKCWPGMEGEA